VVVVVVGFDSSENMGEIVEVESVGFSSNGYFQRLVYLGGSAGIVSALLGGNQAQKKIHAGDYYV
jgi:hypothetical protein